MLSKSTVRKGCPAQLTQMPRPTDKNPARTVFWTGDHRGGARATALQDVVRRGIRAIRRMEARRRCRRHVNRHSHGGGRDYGPSSPHRAAGGARRAAADRVPALPTSIFYYTRVVCSLCYALLARCMSGLMAQASPQPTPTDGTRLATGDSPDPSEVPAKEMQRKVRSVRTVIAQAGEGGRRLSAAVVTQAGDSDRVGAGGDRVWRARRGAGDLAS